MPGSRKLGDVVWARDAHGHYFHARIVAERNADDACKLRVHFLQWSAVWDEWMPADSDGLRPYEGARPAAEPPEYEWASKVGRKDEEDQQYEVEKLLRKRKREADDTDEYLVRWTGVEFLAALA